MWDDEYSVAQGLYDIFEQYRRGRALVLNPEELYVSVYGNHSKYDRYVKFEGDAHELAEIQVTGSYGGPARPFMYTLKELLSTNTGHYAKRIFNENIWYDRHQRGWFVEWDGVIYELQKVCIEKLMPTVSTMMPSVSEQTQKKKNKYGYGNQTLYASYQLVNCITVEIL